MKLYEEMSYWNEREHPSVIGGTMAIDYLKANVEKAKSVLDFGPGIGRTLGAYAKAKFVCAVDISTLYETRLKKAAEEYKFIFATYYLGSVEGALNLPFKTSSYDFAVACQVILHMKPRYVSEVLWELSRVAKKVAIMTLMHQERPYDGKGIAYPRDRYCFNYDMLEMCADLDLDVDNVKFANKNVMLVCSRK